VTGVCSTTKVESVRSIGEPSRRLARHGDINRAGPRQSVRSGLCIPDAAAAGCACDAEARLARDASAELLTT
jgi:hypothetical protein